MNIVYSDKLPWIINGCLVVFALGFGWILINDGHLRRNWKQKHIDHGGRAAGIPEPTRKEAKKDRRRLERFLDDATEGRRLP